MSKAKKNFIGNKSPFLVLLLFLIVSTGSSYAQDTIKFETIKSIKDIPHATLKQKWMWIHRSIAFSFMKERLSAYDTSYYSTYKGKLVITVPISTRFISFELRDGSSTNFLKFQPNSQYDVGISINSKFASFLLNTGVVLFKNDEGTKGKTNYKDYQFNLYGKKSTIDFSLQTYDGFYIQNSNTYENYRISKTQKYEVRPDISLYALSLNHYYLFNNKKVSYRSSFAFTERQKKSAGSFLCGGYLSVFGIKADSSLVSASFTQYFNPTSNIKTGAVLNFGVNVGYIYNLVIRKKIHATLSLVQGLGTDRTMTIKEDDSKHVGNFRLSSKQNLRLALGYDNEKFFFGTMGIYDFYYFDDKNGSTFNYSYGKFRVFVGYRFSIDKQQRRFLQKLNLIDYRL